MFTFVRAYLNGSFSSVQSFQQYIERYGSFGPLILTVFQAVQVVLPFFPGFVGCAAGSLMFGTVGGFLCNYLGICAGSIIAYYLAKRFGLPLILELFPSDTYLKWSDRLSKARSYTAFIFLVMLLPVFPDDFFCYLAGLTKMDAKRFIWIILLGKPWCILAYTLGVTFVIN